MNVSVKWREEVKKHILSPQQLKKFSDLLSVHEADTEQSLMLAATQLAY